MRFETSLGASFDASFESMRLLKFLCKNFAQNLTCFHETSILNANLSVTLFYDGGQNRRVVRGRKYSSVVSAPAAVTFPQAVIAAGSKKLGSMEIKL